MFYLEHTVVYYVGSFWFLLFIPNIHIANIWADYTSSTYLLTCLLAYYVMFAFCFHFFHAFISLFFCIKFMKSLIKNKRRKRLHRHNNYDFNSCVYNSAIIYIRTKGIVFVMENLAVKITHEILELKYNFACM